MPTYIDPHIHMISRVTDYYHRMAQSGCMALSEPAFWAGFDRGSAEASSGEPDVEKQTGGCFG